ncbi:MAG: hypothetical protein ACTSRW_16030 [Candidatus Helarchaeota archaeon]
METEKKISWLRNVLDGLLLAEDAVRKDAKTLEKIEMYKILVEMEYRELLKEMLFIL